MAKYRFVHTEFWTDAKVIEEMTPEDKFFYLYLLTNPHTTQCGIYQITKKQAAFEMGYSIESVRSLFERFENHFDLIRYNENTREVAIRNWAKYNIKNAGKPVVDCVVAEMSKIKDESLIEFVAKSMPKDFAKRLLGGGFDEPSTGRGTYRPQKEKEKEKEKEKQPEKDTFQEVVDAYHKNLEKLPRVKKLTIKRKSHIKARTKELDRTWNEYFAYVSQSDFLQGKNERGWKADFDWLINENNFAKVIEGKYHEHEEASSKRHKFIY